MSSTRLLPSNREAEAQVLGISLLDPSRFGAVREILEPHHFFDPAHQAVFAKMVELARQGKGFDRALFCPQILPYSRLAALMDGVPVRDPAGLARAIKVEWQKREAIRLANNFEAKCYEAKDVADLVSDLQSGLLGLLEESDSGLYSLQESVTEAYATIGRAHERSELPGLPCHIDRLNRTIGGFRPGNLISIGARPGIGKTALAVNFTHHLLKRGAKVLFASIEMTREEIATRILSIASGVSADRLINQPNRLNARDFRALSDALKKTARENVYILDEPKVRSDRLFLAAAAAKAKMGGLDLIVVDYLQLLETALRQHIRSRADYLAEATRDLKRLARRYRMPVIALAQLNREGDEKPSMRHFKETGQIEQESDVALILYRERDAGDFSYVLKVEKNRNGRTGLIHLEFNAETMFFHEPARQEGQP